MPTIYESLRAEIIAAMKARDSAKATALRTADAAIQRAAMDGNVEINDDLVVASLRKAVKNLTDANVDFAKAGRTDLVEANEREIAILERFLPQQISGDQLAGIVADAILSSGAKTRADMGRVMGVLKKHPEAGRLDFAAASKLVQATLS